MDFSRKKVLVIDTEYDTSPKRMLSMAYLIYENVDSEWIRIKELNEYVLHDDSVFQVDENGESFKYHKISNKYLQENGKKVDMVLENFLKDLKDVDIILGQNVISADIDVIRIEALGIEKWDNIIKDELDKKIIFDTMISFAEKNPGVKKSLDNIYKFLFDKEIENHHNALDDCINTFQIFKKMIENDYGFENQKLNFSENKIQEILSIKNQCDLCYQKIPKTKNTYILKNDSYNSTYYNKSCSLSLIPDFLEIKQKICKNCVDMFQIIIKDSNEKMIYVSNMKPIHIIGFFNIDGNEDQIIYLKSEYKDKDEIKKLGGKFDGEKKKWYFICNSKNEEKMKQKFSKWVPNTES